MLRTHVLSAGTIHEGDWLQADLTPLAIEEWRPAPGWSGYEVSNLGHVRSWKKSRREPHAPLPRLLTSWTLPNGYVCVTFKEPGRKGNCYIHHLVAGAFIGPTPDGMEIAHWDGDKLNNALSNLRHATPVENAEDMLRHGHRVMGERHHLAVLTNEQAGELRAFDGTHSEAARAFGVRYHVAYCIRTGRTWKRAA